MGGRRSGERASGCVGAYARARADRRGEKARARGRPERGDAGARTGGGDGITRRAVLAWRMVSLLEVAIMPAGGDRMAARAAERAARVPLGGSRDVCVCVWCSGGCAPRAIDVTAGLTGSRPDTKRASRADTKTCEQAAQCRWTLISTRDARRPH